MTSSILKKLILLAVLAFTSLPNQPLSAEGMAVPTPTAYLERSQMVSTGQQIHVYRVPTVNIDGKVKYYDLTIDFSVLDSGKIRSIANVTSTLSPKLFSNNFVPGTYVYDSNASCTVSTSILNDGRMEVALTCRGTSDSYNTFAASAISGPIEGHPFELDLLAAGIDQIPGYENYSWGKVGYTTGNSDRWGCFNTNEIISARQTGETIVLSNYGQSNVMECGANLIKQ